MKPDMRSQKTKLIWTCLDCKMIIKITALKTHQLNGHKVEQVNFNPNFGGKK